MRVLLFIHGTFSSTVGGFGALGIDENGKGFLRTAIAAYDAVIGFDHKTLSVDPRQNAENLLKRLRRTALAPSSSSTSSRTAEADW